MTAPTKCVKIYSLPPNSREIYKCFNKDISVTWRTKELPISLPPGYLYLGISLLAAGNMLVYVTPLIATQNVP
jgi:hypothetical protein